MRGERQDLRCISINAKRSPADPSPPIVLSDCKFPGPFSAVYPEVSVKRRKPRVCVCVCMCVLVLLSFQNMPFSVCLSKLTPA